MSFEKKIVLCRQRSSNAVPIWYFPPTLLISTSSGPPQFEAIVVPKIIENPSFSRLCSIVKSKSIGHDFIECLLTIPRLHWPTSIFF